MKYKAYSFILFAVTLILGIAEIICGLMEKQFTQIIPSDVFGGFVLIVISAIFLRGLTVDDIKPFFYFGSLMLVVFGLLYVLVLIASGLDALILGEEWNAIENLRVEILLLPLAIPGLILFNKERKTLPP